MNVHKTYLLGIEGVPALRGVGLTINDGEFISILGTSGGGKTTLLNIIGTIDKPSKGDVYICGLRIKFSTKETEGGVSTASILAFLTPLPLASN